MASPALRIRSISSRSIASLRSVTLRTASAPSLRLRCTPTSRPSSSWAAAVSSASRLVEPDPNQPLINPLNLVGPEMSNLTSNIRSLLGSGHPSLDTVAKYYVQSEGKHIRPLMVLLMAQATEVAPKVQGWEKVVEVPVNEGLAPPEVLNDKNPDMMNMRSGPLTKDGEIEGQTSNILASQRRLAEITEMIHAASLLHDDVIDASETRRNAPSGNQAFGNKMAILAGDFLLGRASVALARLRNPEVIELLATVIANLVEGEFMQLKNTVDDAIEATATQETFDYYLQKTYLKTASLIAKSCRASALLGGATPEVADAAYAYGRNLGLAFQIVDDMLDYTVSATDLGKPAGADLQLGLATAPALFAWKHHAELGPMIKRKFSDPGDVERARELVEKSDGLEKTRALAEEYAQKALDAIRTFPESPARKALEQLTDKVLTRSR
ncbi:putative hexaprenyl pyrophosphate synthetase Coq1 [Saitoella complicata NRRL Y-17804]|uniref:Dimethylallyltranstransferase n=1 Tax=Saitoella complicata (strain BCRC 22490 / CBS 7301 / JCM 7358 / NBRC 10748 / NRRL Y-17804) TaxID=698492 RepID=A0A0E9NEB8_SAICN|nr:putative hexaprenyl pyrophosphate synthetase Coq1 [Saitoella complicata NRRL Y-17804]ODQ49625.1 putative hexaprenyl pyrophosphate synthetase Coq1 [Saitoella complicata NRRL Y-17804]GAO48153.1 hypothetical protein G7K_2334-t1 [Saitoella complicata NRRL Y-17804]